jgi:phosphopantetheinyl transferase
VGEQAGSLRLAYRDKGKPYLPDHALHFSVSHSHDRWILALAAAGEIGADIEKIEPLAGMQAIIRTYFHPEEQKRLNALEPQQKMVAFYRQWTQMEAFVKMHGIGLYARMNTIRKLDRTLMFEDQPDSLAACEAYPLYPGYIASIAVRGVMLPAVRMAWTPNPNKSSEECELHAQ